jgi:hypothetical protein
VHHRELYLSDQTDEGGGMMWVVLYLGKWKVFDFRIKRLKVHNE